MRDVRERGLCKKTTFLQQWSLLGCKKPVVVSLCMFFNAALCRKADDPMLRDRTEQAREEAIQLYQQGVKAQALGDYAAAEDCYQRCLLMMRTIGNRNGQAAALHYLGTLYESQGNFDESLKCYEESNTLFDLDQDHQNSLFSIFFQSMLQLKRRQAEESLTLLVRALEMAFRLGPHFVQEAWSRVRQMSGVFFAQRQIQPLIRLGESLEDVSRKILDQGSSPYPMLERLAQMTQQLGTFLMGCGRLWEPPESVESFPEEEVSSWLLQTAVNLDQATGSGLSFTDLAAKVIQERESTL
jgi:tetratricopeptide (TPR) repeat protein